jgi:hypothetical protein
MLFKGRIKALLDLGDYDGLLEMSDVHGGKVSKSLISLTADLDQDRRWRAIRALGLVTSRMYDREPEQARQVVRQLIWNLNEESGGIGWGMPEAFGEILARQEDLAREYACLLACYLVEDESFLETEGLQTGVIWALGRVKAFPLEIKDRIIEKLKGFLGHPNPELKGLAVWSLGELEGRKAFPDLDALPSDGRMISIKMDEELVRISINDLVKQAKIKLGSGKN